LNGLSRLNRLSVQRQKKTPVVLGHTGVILFLTFKRLKPFKPVFLEAASGFEPENNGFADRRLTTWLCRHWNQGPGEPRRQLVRYISFFGAGVFTRFGFLERETGFEPATSTLARLHSTAELFPHVLFFIIQTSP
jgi:hypothetical protein